MAELEQRIEGRKALLHIVRIHPLLRLIHDDDGLDLLKHFEKVSAIAVFVVDDFLVRIECLLVHHHY